MKGLLDSINRVLSPARVFWSSFRKVQNQEGLVSLSITTLSAPLVEEISDISGMGDESSACYPKLLSRWKSAQIKIKTMPLTSGAFGEKQ